MRETCHEVSTRSACTRPDLQAGDGAGEDRPRGRYFVARKLSRMFDFYSGIVQRAIGIP